MATKKSAIIPYRFANEKLEILLITRSSGEGWGIPKGKIEEPLKPHVSATKEAFEEAGVLGCPHPVSIGTYLGHLKSGPVPVFLLEVDIELAKKAWPERKKRARLWVDAGDCDKYITDKKLLAVIERAVACLRSDGEYFKHIIKTFSEAQQWSLVEVRDDYTELEMQGEESRRLRVRRCGSTVRLSIYGSAVFQSKKELSDTFSTTLLERNALDKFGYWCIEQLEDGFVYSYAHNARLKQLDEAYFAEIAVGLAKACNDMQALVKG